MSEMGRFALHQRETYLARIEVGKDRLNFERHNLALETSEFEKPAFTDAGNYKRLLNGTREF